MYTDIQSCQGKEFADEVHEVLINGEFILKYGLVLSPVAPMVLSELAVAISLSVCEMELLETVNT